MLEGIIPILFIPFCEDGSIDETGLRRIARFELAGGVQGIGINGFASEAYKLTEEERWRAAQIVAEEIAGAAPLLIGIAPSSTRQAIAEAQRYESLSPAILMALPPSTMAFGAAALRQHYVALAEASTTPIMLQQAPQIPAYHHCALSAAELAEIARAAPNLSYFKIEGPGSAAVISELRQLLESDDRHSEERRYFGGGGGITVLAEWRAGANGLVPGVGFNEEFLRAWESWRMGEIGTAEAALRRIQPLVAAVSGAGHEHSVYLRKRLMRDAGYIENAELRRPIAPATPRDGWQALDQQDDANALYALVHSLNLRVAETLVVELE